MKTIVIILFGLLFSFSAAAQEQAGGLFTLSYADAQTAISHALSDKGAAPKVAASINGRRDGPIFSHSRPLSIEIRGLLFDKASGQWSGSLLAVSGDEVVTALPAAGRFDELVEVPVLRRPFRNGEVIESADIEIRDIPVQQTRGDTVTDIASLIGQSPLRSISAKRPIRTHEIVAPPLVRKNNIVQMRYTSPGMEITTTGQALEDGSKGSVIGVKNLVSQKTVQAVIEDVAVVRVASSTGPRAGLVTSNPGDSYAAN